MLDHQPLELSNVILVRPRIFSDDRGHFQQTWSARDYAEIGISCRFIQDNESWSKTKGTIRGLHFQAPPEAQAKLVRAVKGSIYDVAVDIRRGSPTYGKHCGAALTASGGEQLYVPAGFAHGFCTLENDVLVGYKVDGSYRPDLEGGIIWDDPDLSIPWPLDGSPAIVSGKDTDLPTFSTFQSPFE